MTILNLFLSISWSILILTNRPIHKILLLCFNIVFIIFLISYITKTSWFSIIFVILIIRGLIVLFFYLASVKQTSRVNYFNIGILPHIFLTTFIFINTTQYFSNLYEINFNSNILNLNIFNSINTNIWVVLLLLILLVFILINLELIRNFYSPLRSKN